MQTLFSNPVMSQNLVDAITNSNSFRPQPDASFNLVPTNPFLKPESPPEASQSSSGSSSSAENATNSTPASPKSDSSAGTKTPHGNSSEVNFVRDRVVNALREIIPHKRSLNLRMLITYTVDNATPDVIVIDKTINRDDPAPQAAIDSSSSAVGASALDLSQRTNPSSMPDSIMNALAAPPNPLPIPDNAAAAASIFNTNTALLMLSSLLNNGNNNNPSSSAAAAALNLPPLNFPLPLNLTSQQTGIAQTNEIPPNVTIKTGEPAMSNTYGMSRRSESSLENASRSSSPLSNRGRESSPSTSVRPTPHLPTYSRRFMHPKRFNCNQCKQNFNSLAELNRHTMDLHSSFRCTFCKARFTQRSNLQRHSLKHVGFKPFACNICRKEYYRKDHLVRHIEVTHPHVDPRVNITTRLSSSECLDFLETMQNLGTPEAEISENGGGGGGFSPKEVVVAVAEEESQGTSFTSPSNGFEQPQLQSQQTEETSEPQAMED